MDEHCLSVRRHSAFHAAQRAAGGSLLLDEHYRSHPEIAALANRLFYGGELTVFTDIRGRPALAGRSIRWRDVQGRSSGDRMAVHGATLLRWPGQSGASSIF